MTDNEANKDSIEGKLKEHFDKERERYREMAPTPDEKENLREITDKAVGREGYRKMGEELAKPQRNPQSDN